MSPADVVRELAATPARWAGLVRHDPEERVFELLHRDDEVEVYVEVPPEAIHRVRHAGSAPAVTIHAYAPPLGRLGTYEIAPGGALLRRAHDAETPLAAPPLVA